MNKKSYHCVTPAITPLHIAHAPAARQVLLPVTACLLCFSERRNWLKKPRPPTSPNFIPAVVFQNSPPSVAVRENSSCGIFQLGNWTPFFDQVFSGKGWQTWKGGLQRIPSVPSQSRATSTSKRNARQLQVLLKAWSSHKTLKITRKVGWVPYLCFLSGWKQAFSQEALCSWYWTTRDTWKRKQRVPCLRVEKGGRKCLKIYLKVIRQEITAKY